MISKEFLETDAGIVLSLLSWFGMALFALLVASEQGYIIDLGFIPPITVNLWLSLILRTMAIYMLWLGIRRIMKIISNAESE